MRLTSVSVALLLGACTAGETSCPSLNGDMMVMGSDLSAFCESLDLETESFLEPGSIDTHCDGCVDTLQSEDGSRRCWVAWGRSRRVGDPPVELCIVFRLHCLEDDAAFGGLHVFANPDGADCELFSTTDVEPTCRFGVAIYPPL